MKSLSRAEFASLGGLLLGLALILSYLEMVFSLSAIVPLPGIKLGLSNIPVMMAFYFISPVFAAVLSFAKVVLSSLLFGTPISFLFSLLGALFAFAALLLHRYLIKDKISYIGSSVLCAAFHLLGQGVASVLVLHSSSAFYYISLLLPFTVLTGGLSGFIVRLLSPVFAKIKKS